MTEDNRKTVIQSFQSEPQAHITQLHLVAMGIEAWIEKDDGGGAYPPLQFSNGVHVMVHAGDAEKACEILRAVEREEGAEAVKEKPAAVPAVRGKAWQVFLVGMLAGTLIAAGVMSYRQHRADNDTMEATMGAGSRLGDLGAPLAAIGQGMMNLPDIDRQTLAGFIYDC